MNYKNELMEKIIPPTDTRFRPDLRSHEEGNYEEADRYKIEIELEQRLKKRKMEDEDSEWKP